MLKAAREEGREEVQELLRKFGFKSVRDMESTLEAFDKYQKDEAAKASDKSKSKDDVDADQKELARYERELRESLLDAGVKRSDLDLAMIVMGRKVSGMSEAQLAKYEPEDFAKEFRVSNPQAFRDYDPDKAYRERRESEIKAEAEAKRIADEAKAKEDAEKAKDPKPVADPPPVVDKATTGNPSNPAPKVEQTKTFNALNATSAEVKARMAQIKLLAAKPNAIADGS